MATIVLSAAGAALGGSVGGTLAGLSTAVIGRAIGGTIGQVVDQRLMGQGSDIVETGRVDRFRLNSTGEGEPISQLYGRMRVGGQVIWASDFAEDVAVSGGGKGAPSQPKTASYSYSVSVAVALCEGEVCRVGRVWADGEEVAVDDLNMRLYKGTKDQLPDALIEAIEGEGQVPAYRGVAYVVMENLSLERFGNRVPQFSFEVTRPEQPEVEDAEYDPTYGIRAVALIPGTGEYSLATTPVHYSNGPGSNWSANVNSPAEKTDFSTSMEMLRDELPNCETASLIVSWFGDDLRVGECRVKPKVEERRFDGANMPWVVSGLSRANAEEIAKIDGRPVYGGTPADASVIEAIKAMNADGKAVMFYPFILMEQLEGNTLPDPYSNAQTQPKLPWRGRITLSQAPGEPGTPDGTAEADAQVDAFFGTVTDADFAISNGQVIYSGPDEWTLSRFILHYAALCKAAGGVDAFCISSEMRGLTQIRGAGNAFVAVDRLRILAAQVRAIVGPATKISYASDWSEYFGYQPPDGSGDRLFHLDALWADDNIDFIGIDNYMPLSDWRDTDDHLDADAGSIYDLDYLRSNVAGGEGYDWFYASDQDRADQVRTPISDGAFGEPWIYRYKDLLNWWDNRHHDRVGGQRAATPTAWQPRSKPFWFTELGCAAIDKGTNQPNKFLDPKSSESRLPYFSTGARDDFIQMQYLRAMASYWDQPEHNPISGLYGGRMVDMRRAYVWAWDVRPYPYFPNNAELWSDGDNYFRGHWLNGRTSARSLASVVAEVCRRADVRAFDVSKLYGSVRGYTVADVADARTALQPLMLRYGFDAVERDGMLIFRMRDARDPAVLDRNLLAVSEEFDGRVEQVRTAQAEMAGRVRLRFVQADAAFDVLAEEAVLAEARTHSVSTSEFPLVMTRAEGRQTVERWLTEAQVARETVRFAMPPSQLSLGAGDIVSLPADQGEGTALYRIDRVEQGMLQHIDAVRIEPEISTAVDIPDERQSLGKFVAPVPVQPLFLDLPLIAGDEVPHAPYIAATAQPWPGNVALYQSFNGSDYVLDKTVSARSVIGRTLTPMARAGAGRFDRGPGLEVELASGALSTVDEANLLAGRNLAAIGDGGAGRWELFQFAKAELVGPNRYVLSQRLRGQLGSDGIMPDIWPEGSWFVLMNGAPEQTGLKPNLRRVSQTYRIGPARRPVSDPSYVEIEKAFDGNGLRPYAPVHLRSGETEEGDLALHWIRRTRVDGDAWDAPEVPLGEEAEAYIVTIRSEDEILRQVQTSAPEYVYSAADQVNDAAERPFTVEVAQVSSSYGAGPAAAISVGE